MVDLEVFVSLQRQSHQLGKQAENSTLRRKHWSLNRSSTWRPSRMVQDQVEQKRGWLIGETVIGSDPQQCQVKLASISIRSDLACVSSVADMMKIGAFSDGVVNN